MRGAGIKNFKPSNSYKAMKILQICPKPPYPPVDGGAIAMNNVTLGLLREGHRVKLLATHTFKHDAKTALRDERYLRETGFETDFVDIRLKPLAMFFNLFSPQSYNIERFYSPALEARIQNELQRNDYDVILLESLYTVRYLTAIRRATHAPVVYREHNIEHHVWQGTWELERNEVKRAYLKTVIEKLKRFEVGVLNRFDGIAAITAADRDEMRALGAEVPIEVIPFGVNLENIRSDAQTEPNTVFHLGAMDWLPNQDGISWFIKQAWPLIETRHPKARLHLAGRNMPSWLLDLRRENVTVAGEVKSAHDFMKSKAVMVVPLFSGSGMRIKLIEGMALGRPIVSTPLGAEGIDYEDGRHLLIARNRTEFADAVCRLLKDPEQGAALGRTAFELVAEAYDNAKIARKLARFCEAISSGGESIRQLCHSR